MLHKIEDFPAEDIADSKVTFQSAIMANSVAESSEGQRWRPAQPLMQTGKLLSSPHYVGGARKSYYLKWVATWPNCWMVESNCSSPKVAQKCPKRSLR